MNALTIGMIGFGSIARTHCMAVAAIAADTGLPVRIGKIYRRDRSLAAPFFSLGYAQTLEELISESDVVDICSTNDVHFEQAAQVIRAGKKLYLEKPVGVNMAQAEALARLAGDCPVRNQVALMYRFMPGVIAIRDLVAAGEIGEVIEFQCRVQHSGYLNPSRKSNWKLKKAASGGGPLLDIGVHIMDLIRFSLGEVDAVAAEMKTVIRQRPDEKTGQPVNVDVEDCAQVRVRLVNGMEGIVEITRVASVLEQSSTFSVYGTAGSLHFTAAAPGRLRVYRQADARETCGAAPLGSAFAQHVAGLYPRTSLGWMTDAHMASQLHFYRSLLLEDEPVYRETPTIAEAALSQRVVEAGYRSAALDGKMVRMCDLPV